MKNNKNIYFPEPKKNNLRNIYWVNGLLILAGAKKNAKKLAEELKRYKIETRPFFWPMHEQDIFKKMKIFPKKKYTNSSYLGRYGFYIPSFLKISNSEMNYIISKINKLL